MDEPLPTRRFPLRFTLSQLFVLILGISLGFLPLKLWELQERTSPEVMIDLKIIKVPSSELSSLGIPESPFIGGKMPAALRNDQLLKVIERLRRESKISIVAEPSLIALDGHDAAFSSGGEIPLVETSKDGSSSIRFKKIGTYVSLRPTILRNGHIRLSIAPQFGELDTSTTVSVGDMAVHGSRSRSVQTVIEAENGASYAFAGFTENGQAGISTTTLMIATVTRVESAIARN